MPKIFSSDVKRRISEYEYADIGALTIDDNAGIVEVYNAIYQPLRAVHPQYNRGWGESFFHDHRFMSRVVLQMFDEEILDPVSTLCDIGTYDGMLPALLFGDGVNAYGTDETCWASMWKALDIYDSINTDMVGADIATVLNYAHNWRPEQIFEVVREKCGGMPSVILMDREVRTPHVNNALWMDDALLAGLGIEVVKLPKCKVSRDSDRDLLIWEQS